MHEKYSRGFHASVYKVDRQQKLWFPSADLVKIDQSRDKNWFARLFYRHKIAQLLFPDNFINVVAAQVDPWQEQLVDEFTIGKRVFKEQKSREHKLFSKMALVPATHAVFSEHMDINMDISSEDGGSDSRSEKVSLHDCADCNSHRVFHISNGLEQKAMDIAPPMQKIGIHPPTHDPSDYCLTKEGDIIFFEVQNFQEEQLETHLSSLKSRTENEETALRLLKRFDALYKDSRRVLFSSGAGGEIRLN